MANQWIDISVPLRTGMVHWPGDPTVTIERVVDMDRGAVCNVSRMDLCAHAGTHMDGLLHFVRDGAGLETLPLEAAIGPCRVIRIRDRKSVKADELIEHRLRRGERILLRTRNSERPWWKEDFNPDFVHISHDAAVHLAERRIATIGIDYLSVGGYQRDGVETHQVLLGAGIWIIEGLTLGHVPAGRYDLVCLPVKIANSDGAPARAVVRRRR